MKKCIIAAILIMLAVTVYARAIRDEQNLADEKARTSYAFGMTVGNDLRQAGLELDYAAFTGGLRTAMENDQTMLDQEQALEIVQNAFENAMRKQAAEQMEKEFIFLTENASREGIQVTESGLQYMVLEEGRGPKPASGDTVRVHYEGALTDGTVFDSSYQQGNPEEIPLDMVIPGWAEGLQLMNTGGKYLLYIPSSLAYGEQGAGYIIPPYSTLVFTIELLEILNSAE